MILVLIMYENMLDNNFMEVLLMNTIILLLLLI